MALGDNEDIQRMATRLEFLIERVSRLENQVATITSSIAAIQVEMSQMRRDEQIRSTAAQTMTAAQIAWLMLAFVGIATAIVLAIYVGGRTG